MLELECKVIAEEGQDHWAFVEACLPEAHRVLMYPLQLLTGGILLVSIFGNASYHFTIGYSGQGTDLYSFPTNSVRHINTPNWNQMAVLLIWPGSNHTKTWGRGSCGARHHSRRVAPLKAKRREGRPLARLLKESHWEAFGKDTDLVWVTRQVYFKMHHPHYDHKGSNNLSHTFKEMATSAGIMGFDVHEVQEACTGQKDLWVTHHMEKSSPKGYPFLPGGASHWIAQDHGLRGIHSPRPWGSEVVCPSACGGERRTEWRHSGEPPAHQPLPPWPHLQPMHRVLHNQHWCYVLPLTTVSQHWLALMMMMTTKRKNLTSVITVMMTLHLARISTALSISCCQQSGCHHCSTLVFMPGWGFPCQPWVIQFGPPLIRKCTGAHCLLSNWHNHSVFSHYSKLFSICKVW